MAITNVQQVGFRQPQLQQHSRRLAEQLACITDHGHQHSASGYSATSCSHDGSDGACAPVQEQAQLFGPEAPSQMREPWVLTSAALSKIDEDGSWLLSTTAKVLSETLGLPTALCTHTACLRVTTPLLLCQTWLSLALTSLRMAWGTCVQSAISTKRQAPLEQGSAVLVVARILQSGDQCLHAVGRASAMQAWANECAAAYLACLRQQ